MTPARAKRAGHRLFFAALWLAVLMSRSALAGFRPIDFHAHLTRRAMKTSANHTDRERPETLLERALATRTRLTRKDIGKSIRLLRQSVRLAHTAEDSRGEAQAELELGDTYQMISAYPAAMAAYGRALTASGKGSEQSCEVYIRMARSDANSGKAERARGDITNARVICAAISQPRIRAELEEAEGETALFSDHRPDAIAPLERAISLAVKANDPEQQALATMRLASSEPTDSNGSLQSLLHAQSALAQYRSIGDEYGAARAHALLSFLTSASGDPERSRCHGQLAIRVFQRIGDIDDEASSWNAMAFNAKLSGDLDEALKDYRLAKRLFASANDPIGEEASIANISSILLAQRRYSALTPLYARANTLGLQVLSHSLLASALLDSALLDHHSNHNSQAEARFEKGFAEFQLDENRRGEGDVRIGQASFEIDIGRLDDAVVHLKQAQTLKEQTGEVADLAKIDFLRARALFVQNRLDDALVEIEKTIAIVESQRLRISMFDSRAQYFASVHEYYSLYIRLLMHAGKLRPGGNFAQLAFEAAERSKVRSLLDMLGGSQQTFSCKELLASDAVPPLTAADQTLIGKSDSPGPSVLTLAEIQSMIGDDETSLLEFSLDREESFAWLLDGHSLTSIALGPSGQIEKNVSEFRKSLVPVQPQPRESPAGYLQRLQSARSSRLRYAKTLSGLLFNTMPLPARRRLLIVPDGALQYLPIAALCLPGGKATAEPLISRYELSTLPSASTLIALRKAASARSQPENIVAIFGDPVFEPPSVTHAKSGTPGSVPRSRALTRALLDSRGFNQIPSLPGSRSEALAIQAVFQSGATRTQLALQYDANRDAILAGSIARQKIIHFATHGIIDTRHPELSGLVLSMVNRHGQFQDGYLRLQDIYHLKLSADLVVLSACESALGKDLGSEGIIGLPRGFLHAGAKRVIASLWKVDDEATVALMRSFYTRFERGVSPSAALQSAQLDLLKDPRYSDPYYWAGFVLEGDYK